MQLLCISVANPLSSHENLFNSRINFDLIKLELWESHIIMEKIKPASQV